MEFSVSGVSVVVGMGCEYAWFARTMARAVVLVGLVGRMMSRLSRHLGHGTGRAAKRDQGLSRVYTAMTFTMIYLDEYGEERIS